MELDRRERETVKASNGLLAGIMAAIGSAWSTKAFRQIKVRDVRYVSWAGRADTDSWFLFQLEQSKNRVLYYNARNQAR